MLIKKNITFSLEIKGWKSRACLTPEGKRR